MNAVLLHPDGIASRIELDTSDDGSTLRSLQTHVEGLVDCIGLDDGIDVWVGDEALLRGQPVNYLAMAYLHDHAPEFIQRQRVIWGPAVLTSHDSQGKTTALPDHAAQEALRYQMQIVVIGPNHTMGFRPVH